MPEAGRTPSPSYEKGSALPQGVASQANSLMGLVGPLEEPEGYAPAGEEEGFLFGQTERPDEALTAGAPIGDGPDFTRHAIEDDAQFATRVADRLAATAPTKEVRALADRLRRGL